MRLRANQIKVWPFWRCHGRCWQGGNRAAIFERAKIVEGYKPPGAGESGVALRFPPQSRTRPVKPHPKLFSGYRISSNAPAGEGHRAMTRGMAAKQAKGMQIRAHPEAHAKTRRRKDTKNERPTKGRSHRGYQTHFIPDFQFEPPYVGVYESKQGADAMGITSRERLARRRKRVRPGDRPMINSTALNPQ